jgi:hypothetical protein
MKTIITLTSIPPRFEQTAKNLNYLLSNLKNPNETTVILNIPLIYKRFMPNTKGRRALKRLRLQFSNLRINELITDMGPITKLYHSLPFIRSQPTNSIVLILDDEMYRPDAIERIIKCQYDNLFTVHSYWVYQYNNISVPQGVDIIATSKDLLADSEQFINKNLNSCRYVDDLMLAEYFRLKGVPVKQIARFWKWPWIPTHKEGTGLFESGKRETQMSVCAKNFN